MKAARLAAPKTFEFLDVETPSLKDGESIVKMEYLSICGSDLRTYDRVLPEESYPLRVGASIHECVRVADETTSDELRKAQRVIGVANAGGIVQHATVPPNRLV